MDLNGVVQVEQQGEKIILRIRQGPLSTEAELTKEQAREIAWAILYKTDERIQQMMGNTFNI